MKSLLILSILFFASCSHKTIAKNCLETDSEYWLCDSLNALGK